MTLPPDSFEHPWERRLHEELRQLPDLEAPSTLIPGVMAAIRAREAAAIVWYRRPATDWPPALRIALAVGSLAVFAALVFGAHLFWPQLAASAETGALADAGRRLAALWTALETVVNALGLAFRATLSSPWFIAAVAAACVSYLTLLGAGSALWRTVLSPRNR